MKKLPFLALLALFTMCKSAKHISNKKDYSVNKEVLKEKDKKQDEEEELEVFDLPEFAQIRDDFRSVSEPTKNNYLAGMRATEDMYSVVILTQGYKGENISIKNKDKSFFNAMTMSDLSTGIAKSIRVDNTKDFIVKDNYTNGEVIIENSLAKKFKFIYIMKNNANKKTPFKVTFSNTLRPVR
ncbi:hypothetical protein ACYSNX_00075 [Myroides sp. LJL115]